MFPHAARTRGRALHFMNETELVTALAALPPHQLSAVLDSVAATTGQRASRAALIAVYRPPKEHDHE